MYSISAYGNMITDQVRMAAYTQALRQAIKPGCRVLELGTGTGIFALLACQLGAGQVIAIEPSDAIQVARQTAAANGYAEQICFIQDISTRISLPERADVILSDLRGVLPLFQQHIPSIVDARQRLLAPGGVLIPRRDTLWATVVEVPELYQRFSTPWEKNEYGLNLQAASQIVTNTWVKARIKPHQCLASAQSWAILDYTTIETPNVHAELTWEITRPGVGHGLCLWFDATLADGITFSNAPTEPEAIYGSAFFPWSKAVALTAGDVVSVHLRADLVGEEYVWRWDTRIHAKESAGRHPANFKQSTFFGAPLSLAQLQKQRADYRPTLSQEGQIDCFILTQMAHACSLGDIAHLVVAEFPHRFATWQAALTRVGDLSRKYSLDPESRVAR
jgi:type I protein arginine methyltransferase